LIGVDGEERSLKPVNYLRRGWAELPRTKQLTADQYRVLRRQLNEIDAKLHQLSQAELEPRRR
jgi:hypothetical protein